MTVWHACDLASWKVRRAGISMRELLTRVGLATGADLRGAELGKTVIVTGADGYKVAFAIAELDPSFTQRTSILADQKDGTPLPANAAPFQIILSGEVRPAGGCARWFPSRCGQRRSLPAEGGAMRRRSAAAFIVYMSAVVPADSRWPRRRAALEPRTPSSARRDDEEVAPHPHRTHPVPPAK